MRKGIGGKHGEARAVHGAPAGQLRALITTTPERYKEIASVPTTREAGYPQLERIIGWSALYGPPGMDRKLVAYWGAVLQKVAKDAQSVGATEKIGSVPPVQLNRFSTPSSPT